LKPLFVALVQLAVYSKNIDILMKMY